MKSSVNPSPVLFAGTLLFAEKHPFSELSFGELLVVLGVQTVCILTLAALMLGRGNDSDGRNGGNRRSDR